MVAADAPRRSGLSEAAADRGAGGGGRELRWRRPAGGCCLCEAGCVRCLAKAPSYGPWLALASVHPNCPLRLIPGISPRLSGGRRRPAHWPLALQQQGLLVANPQPDQPEAIRKPLLRSAGQEATAGAAPANLVLLKARAGAVLG